MAYDGKLLALARDELEAVHAANQQEQRRRTDEVYRRIPEIRRIDSRMRAEMADVIRITLSGAPDIREKIDALHEENTDLKMRKAELLTEKGYPITYLDEIYSCPKCRDTGVYESGVCECLQKLYNREVTKSLGTLMRSGDASFETFDLSLYGNTWDNAAGCVPREIMQITYEGCRKFADQFPNVSSNLLLQGGTGLGKTFLSACIARVVAGKGCSVCYESATPALEAFEVQKFSRDADAAETAGQKVSRMLDCDLMILDDLGTEMTTPMSTSALYTLINTRLNAKKPTVISTNLTPDELQKRYNAQIASRLAGEYLRLPFVGRDIRLMKNR